MISFLLIAGSASRRSWIIAGNEYTYLQLEENFRNFLTKNNTAPAGIIANNSNKYAKGQVANTIMITDGIANANIKSSKYLFISADIGVMVVGDLVRF